jgi:hypothetical protein
MVTSASAGAPVIGHPFEPPIPMNRPVPPQGTPAGATPVRKALLPREVENRLRNWWAGGGQEHPLILATVQRANTVLPSTGDLNRHWLDQDFIMERKLREIEATEYHGVAVPYHYVDHGSSAMAGVLGCPLVFVDPETIWANPRFETLDQVLDCVLGTDAEVYAHITEITRRSTALARDHHFVAPFALEGMSDLMAALYGGENFMMDLMDRPEDVMRAMERLKSIWLKTFSEISRLIAKSGNPGGIGWVGIWAPGSTFPMQEDVSYSISAEMFRRFLIPHIRDQIAAMEYSFFHVDGMGMIPHLDALLEIRELKAIQWQPGAGHERLDKWYELLRKILAAGKSLQVYARAEEVEALVHNVGADRLLVIVRDATRDEIRRLTERYQGQA